ncbi:MAG: ankyrin repeat domain-containing protein, partial [Planctomycetaceae bacterium]
MRFFQPVTCGLCMVLWVGCSGSQPETQEPSATPTEPSSAQSPAAQPPATETGAAAPSPELWTAAAVGNIASIKQFVAQGHDVNGKEPSRGSTPLILACVFGQTEAAGLLIANGANLALPNNDGTTPLLAATIFAWPDTVALLLQKGADPNVSNLVGATAMSIASAPWGPEQQAGYQSLAETLQMQLDLQRIQTALPQIADILREHNAANPQAGASSKPTQPASGKTDLWSAAAEGNLQRIRKHVAAGTDLNLGEPSEGSTPLMLAALFGQTQAAALLIENGARVKSGNSKGDTALHLAAFFAHPETVKLLLAKGADRNAKNNMGATPLTNV